MTAPDIEGSAWRLKRAGTTNFWIFGSNLHGCSVKVISQKNSDDVWTGHVRKVGTSTYKHMAQVTYEEPKDGKIIDDDDLATVDITVTNDETDETDATTDDVAIE